MTIEHSCTECTANRMQELPVYYLVLTACILFVQCFGIDHNKIVEDIKKENLENALGDSSDANVENSVQIRNKDVEKVDCSDASDKQKKIKGSTKWAQASLDLIKTRRIRGKVLNSSHISSFNSANVTNAKNLTKTQQNIDEVKKLNNNQDEVHKLVLPLTNYLSLNLETTSKTLKISLDSQNHTKLSRSLGNAMKGMMKPPKGLSPMLPYVLAPALTMAGVLPWLIPGIRMAAGFVQMINQMAFMAGLFALIRGYIFEHQPGEHVVYVNHGYNNKHHDEHYGHGKVNF